MESCLINFNLEDASKNNNEVNTLIAHLKNAIADEPDILDYYFQLKSLYSSYLKAGTLALETLEKALAYFPNNVKLLAELAAVCEFELEDYTKAKMYYERVLALDPTHKLALDGLAVLNDKIIHP